MKGYKNSGEPLKVIRIDSSLDIRPSYKMQAFKYGPITFEDKHHLSHMRLVMQDKSLFNDKVHNVTAFALQGHKVTQSEVDSLPKDKFELVYL
jgi:hypothetical protein